MQRRLDAPMWAWMLFLLALVFVGCATERLSARQTIRPASIVAQSAQVCPTAPAVVCIAVTVTPGVPAQLVTATPHATALATVTPWPTPTQIVRLTDTPVLDTRSGTYSPFFQQRIRAGAGVNWAQVGWLGGGTVWQVIDVTYYSNGDYWVRVRDSARGIDGWCAVIYTGLVYGVFTPQ